ncbi:hypothetical protein SynRS9915_01546 [Synechococcus sp. RS9915]|nr:hypothetical protein SynRS9915_01546 [Synechococcus sp. RS9915]
MVAGACNPRGASALYPHLSQEQAMIRSQLFRLAMRWQRDQELS